MCGDEETCEEKNIWREDLNESSNMEEEVEENDEDKVGEKPPWKQRDR